MILISQLQRPPEVKLRLHQKRIHSKRRLLIRRDVELDGPLYVAHYYSIPIYEPKIK